MNIIIKNTDSIISESIKTFNIGNIETTLQDLLDNTTIEIEKNQIVILKLNDGTSYLLPLKYNETSIYGFGKNIQDSDLTLLNGSVAPKYKVYTALLTQKIDKEPTLKILENTLGELTSAYNGVGYYSLTSDNLFTLDKTYVIFGGGTTNHLDNDTNISVEYYKLTLDQIAFTSQVTNDPQTAADNLLENTILEIRVYD